MNFEKVEMYGFKSFADKAEIKFGNGITAIVGPNGCGKSNVADAVRWVLGEQSAKTLRGSSMQDVIFAGTQGRKSLSYCEVSLFFDNSNKMFSLDYNEVIITRKLFRSGESEYYINRQPARLKDIVDLLHECGIGKEGYTIIGQGKVEEIMSAKPEDRRLIFEEATGIAKNKTKKNETERKLERTHENLIRLSDILSEIENQLVPLERQANKAKEFNELSEELKFHELNTYMAKVDGVETAKNKIRTRINGIDEQTALRNIEFAQTQSEYDKIMTESKEADQKLRDYNEELLTKRVKMEESSGMFKVYNEKISALLSQIERAKGDIETNISIINESRSAISVNREKIIEDEKKLKDLLQKADAASKKLLSVSEKITLGEELSEANRKKVIESIESLSDFKVNKGTMSIEKSNLLEKKDELLGRLDESSVRRDKLFNEKESCDKEIDNLDRSVFDLKNQIAEKENEVREGNEKVAKTDNAIFSLNSLVATLQTRDAYYKEAKENYEGYAPAVKLLFGRAKQDAGLKRRIKGVVAELISCDKKFDIAIETSLAAAAQNVVTATTDDAKYLIAYLKENKLGRLTFLPIESVKPREQSSLVTSALNDTGALGVANNIVAYDAQFENVISNLLGNTLIVDNIDNATRIANKYHFGFKIVTLDGDVFSTQGAMTGGSRRQDSVGVLSNDRKIEDNAEQLRIKRAEMDKLKGEKAALEKERDKALDELGLLNEMYNGKRQQILLAREKQATLENALSEIGKNIENSSDLIEEVEKRIAKIDLEYEAVNSGSKKLEEARTSAKESADKQQAEYDALRKVRDELSEENTRLQVAITELRAGIDSAKDECERLKTAVSDAEESNARLSKSNENAEFIIENFRREQEKVSLSKEEQDYINGIRDKIDNIEKYKIELSEKLEHNADKRQSLTDELNALSEKKHAEEIELAKIDSDLEHLQQSVWEDYQETYETAQKVRAEGYDEANGVAEINRIRKKRASLGAINATAIDDFKLLKERYDENLVQKEDLEKAEGDLRQVIDTLKGEMLKQFDEGFKKINENFQKIFKELFGGGRAMLELDYTEVDDKLEAGVEIIAEPPGKKLQKLSLLSGGEKALTAIAILFAILKLRPMPFCILDEIEAALDEANVDRFARYLQKFSQETQFIVITHRKPTMEMADSLFGVTMQEKGVSKMVSVKLSDVSAFDKDAS